MFQWTFKNRSHPEIGSQQKLPKAMYTKHINVFMKYSNLFTQRKYAHISKPKNPKHWLHCTWPQFFPINREISMFFIARTNQTEHFGLSLLIFKIFKRSYKLCYVSQRAFDAEILVKTFCQSSVELNITRSIPMAING